MPGTYLNLPYDEEIFNYQWKNTPDVVLTTMFDSGAVVRDSEIENLISVGGNFFVSRYYDLIGGTPQLYDGATDFNYSSITGGSYTGVVYGRQQAWNANSFAIDFNKADPMGEIVKQVAQYWHKFRQTMLLKLLNAVFGITGDADWALHTTNLTTSLSSVADTNLIGATTINDACVKANGDNNTQYTLAIMHSVVANRLANLQLLEFKKYTDANGIEQSLPIGTINGKTIIVNDNVPVADSATASGAKEYTTYILGNGCIRYAEAPVDRPSEMDRDPKTNGGMDMLYTRFRESLTAYGFSFVGDMSSENVAITDATFEDPTSYERKMPAKSIFMAKVVTNG